MQTKLRIDLAQGIIDVEGDESFVRQIYDDYKERLKGIDLSGLNEPESKGHQEPKGTKP